MEPGKGARGPLSHHVLAGLETGIVSALALLSWLGLSSLWYRKSFWTAPNLLASTLYGDRAMRDRFDSATFTGLALYVIIYGSIGVLFGLLTGNRRSELRLTCLGILTGIAWYYLSFGWIWMHWKPLIALYTHDRPMFAGHVLYGALLGRYPRYRRALQPEEQPAVQAEIAADTIADQP